MKIAILGAGAFGTALGGILANNGYDIDYYDSAFERERLGDVLKSAKYIVLCVPSKAVSYLLPHLPKDIPLIVATKGLLSESGLTLFEDWMVISGPGFADDIKARKRTILSITDRRLAELFAADYMEYDFVKDKRGVLMCGALKNVYAILAGYKGLKPDSLRMKWFLRGALDEMARFLDENGADPSTVYHACGIGDLRLTCAPGSRNFEFGQRVAQDPKYRPEKTVEGFTALAKIKRGEIKVPEGMKYIEKLIELSEGWY